MFVKSKLTQKLAIANRVYTGKTCLHRLKILGFSLVHAGRPCLYSSDSAAWHKPYDIRPRLLKHPLNSVSSAPLWLDNKLPLSQETENPGEKLNAYDQPSFAKTSPAWVEVLTEASTSII